MAPIIRLDFSTEGYLTDAKTGSLILGLDNQSQRVAHDMVSGDEFVKIAETIPSDLSQPKHAAIKAWLDSVVELGIAYVVSGHGFWVKRDNYDKIRATAFDVDKAKALGKKLAA